MTETMSLPAGLTMAGGVLALGGAPLDRPLAALRTLEPQASAFWAYDLDQIEARAARFRRAFAPLRARPAYALKANALPAVLERVCAAGLAAEAGSLGELLVAKRTGFGAADRNLNGNGRTVAEAAFAAREGVHSVNADHAAELDLLEREARAAGATVRVALRVNPGIETPGHRYVATGDDAAKFGIAPAEALDAWAARARWPHLRVDGVHLHVGSQLLDGAPLERAAETARALVAESAARGAPLSLVNLGGGFGVDYSDAGAEFPLERHAAHLVERFGDLAVEWLFEPGRWIVAPAGVLVAEVLWVKERPGPDGATRRFVVLAAGMNDLIRPALYHARHRVVPVRPRAGAATPAVVVGPVCESADIFEREAMLPPIERGDLVAILDAGAYGAVMASNYNGRPRLAELTVTGGRWTRARAGEPADAAAGRASEDRLEG
ncbi:MAG: diaminopimelate decarboxylase [Candidatus Eisenbacteria bacterium]|uniref:Diaminopimelate decarboxylase n=1 Tax=Eiseniibacteriota bacterium TaxID=2212470 RepID=A0A9D6LBR2_UNCEI|nr:diaminopimelate decarboxylase [Candidatus Eisenbacteria bacterium]MBI3540467.1 diaminopimelate decarboxylase [Candidatus Eisenbacteria bacterium]